MKKTRHRKQIRKVSGSASGVVALAVIVVLALLYARYSNITTNAGTSYEPGYFQVGWYHTLNDVTSVDDLARTGVRSAFVYPTFYSGLGNYLVKANSDGVKLGLGLNPEWFGKDGVDVEKIKNAVRQYKNAPGVASYMSYDEPNQFRSAPYYATPEAIKTAYNAIKSVDSRRVFVNFTRHADDAELREYAPGFDIFGVDFYTAGRGQGEFANIGTWNTFVAQVKRGTALQTELRKGYWPVLQAFGPNNNKNNIQPPPFRLPTAKEFRFMMFLPFVYRTDGVLLYAYQYAKEYPEWMSSVLQPTLDEMTQYSHLNRNVQLVSVNSNCADCVSGIKLQTMRDRVNPKLNYLVVVNETKNPLSPTFNFSRGLAKVERSDNSGRRWTGNNLTAVQDEIPAFGVYIYRLTSDRIL